MGARFEELAWAETATGEIISLRRRSDALLGRDVLEIKLGDEFLMSSSFTVAEEELARLGLAELPDRPLDVVVGGLGLGYTARAVLEDERVASLIVVEAIGEVIAWHESGLVPDTTSVRSDERARFVRGDFFAMAASRDGFDPDQPGRRFDAVLVDIDHSPDALLDPSHAGFYSEEGLTGLRRHLRPDGVFALWSDDPPAHTFMELLNAVFEQTAANVVEFDNPYTGGRSANTVYVAG